MMRNKRGFIPLLIVGVVIVLIILGGGFIFFNKIVAALGSKWFLYAAIFVLVVIFRNVLQVILLTIWGWLRAIVAAVFGK